MQMSGQFLATVASLPWKEVLVLLQQDAVCAPGQVWTFWKRKNFFASVGDETPDHPAHCVVTIPFVYAIPASLFYEVVPYKTFIMSMLILSAQTHVSN
jgi:hypothetical protein